ncbi:MAG: tetratricopeptide repeat protein [Pseudomonadota bacterium]|nr:tetratricopeptide repeat protein [Pseudomonadota bacterium]
MSKSKRRLAHAAAGVRSVTTHPAGQATALPTMAPAAALWALVDSGRAGEARALLAQARLSAAERAHLEGMFALIDGDSTRAAALLRLSVTEDPVNARAWYLLGRTLRQAGELEAAIAAYRQAAQQEPALWQAHSSLGNALKSQGRLDEAIVSHRQACALAPDVADNHVNLGNALLASARPEPAAAAYAAALARAPEHAAALQGAATAAALRLLDARDWEGARAAFAAAMLRFRPSIALCWGYSKSLWRLGRSEDAERAFEQALALAPDDIETRMQLALMRSDQRQFPEAVRLFRALLAEIPEHPMLLNNLGSAELNLGLYAEARTHFALAIRHAADDGRELETARFNLGIVDLLEGDPVAGWRNYASRFAPGIIFADGRPDFGAPSWQGETLDEGYLLLWGEQGLGDTLQFIRYLPALCARMPGRLMVRVQDGLEDLLAHAFPQVPVVPMRAPLPAPAREVALLDLPRLLALETCPQPIPVPYLQPSPAARQRWQARLGAHADFRVGLVWAGNPEHVRDHERSIALARLAPLAAAGARFYAFQAGAAAQAQAPAGLELTHLAADFHSMDDTAAALLQMDLLIGVDTSVIHLAGALGVPAWVLVTHVPDWRWGLHGERSDWYPTLRIFRQASAGDWDSVIAAVAAALTDEVPARLSSRISAEPGSPLPYLALGRALMRLREFDAALTPLKSALLVGPGHPDVLSTLDALLRAVGSSPRTRVVEAEVHRHHGRLEQAMVAYELALKEHADAGEIRCNLAMLQYLLGDLEGAEVSLAAAAAAGARPARVAYNRSFVRLLRGQLPAAWDDYEHRFEGSAAFGSTAHPDLPIWRGEPLHGKRLLLTAEQGLGDTIQFLRFLPQLARLQPAALLVTLPRPLLPVLGPLQELAEFHASDSTLPDADLHCPLLSVPQRLRCTLDEIGMAAPYLAAPATAGTAEHALTAGRIAIVWRGNPAHPRDRERSLALEILLAALPPELPLCSLQFGLSDAERLQLQARGSPAAEALHDLGDTAVLLTGARGLISVDTSTVHLAGALALPAAVLLSWMPDPRWMLASSATPWYPSVRLLRQHQRGDWSQALIAARAWADAVPGACA